MLNNRIINHTKNNSNMKTTEINNSMIEAAYMAGFEPSTDKLTGDALLAEAEEYLTMSLTF